MPQAKMLHMNSGGSLRTGFVWTFAGNGVYAVGQWAILSLLAKLGSREMLGEYALALAITSPVLMLSHLNLRAVLATDIGEKQTFGDYLTVRLAATLLGLFAIAVIGWSTAGFAPMAIVIVAAGVAQSAENVSDIYYGAMQRRERMDSIAQSMMARAVVSVAAMGIVLAATRSMVAAVIALAGARLAVLLVYDRRVGSAGERLARSGTKAQLAILRAALPLGVVLMLASLNTNLPRYEIERRLGTSALGAFAAVASFMTAGNTVVNALGQAATPRLARYFAEFSRTDFLRLTLQLVALALALGAAGVVVAAAIGAPILRILYRPEYAQHASLLTEVMAAAIPAYVAGILGYVITSVRAFDAQAPLLCAVVAACGITAWLAIPKFGLAGAPMALAAAACVQICGEAIILICALQRMEAAR
jgi:O-antigen/teichoic acid export membrane protein